MIKFKILSCSKIIINGVCKLPLLENTNYWYISFSKDCCKFIFLVKDKLLCKILPSILLKFGNFCEIEKIEKDNLLENLRSILEKSEIFTNYAKFNFYIYLINNIKDSKFLSSISFTNNLGIPSDSLNAIGITVSSDLFTMCN